METPHGQQPPLQTPMVGSWDVTVNAVKPFTIHGDLYFEVHVVKTDDPHNRLLALRIPQHAAEGTPHAGEKWRLTFLMGQVTQGVLI